jgi:hypothetical protein
MGKFPFFVEHIAFDKRASFLQIPLKMGNFPFIDDHIAFDKIASFLQIP